jgi:signal peptidase I
MNVRDDGQDPQDQRDGRGARDLAGEHATDSLPHKSKPAIAASSVDRPEPYNVAASAEQPPPPHQSATPRLFRTIYWATWFVLVPFVLACILVWALTPPSGVEQPGVLGFIQSHVREQPVPVGIVAFTLSRHAHPPLRPDLPESMRAPFDRARALLEEADNIFARHEKSVVRELTLVEREKLKADMDGLREAMDRTPFDEDAFVDALVRADGEVDVRLGRWRKSEVREYLESIVVAIMVAMALRSFVVEAFKIPSGSMIPTLQVGDHIFVNKFTYGPAIPFTKSRFWESMPPHRGDVMVFAFPEHPEQDFIKRVIAIPGDTLEARNGHPFINGWEVPHCDVGVYSYSEVDSLVPSHEGELYVEFLEDEAYLTLYDRIAGGSTEYQGPFTVKPGEAWVMGDNRNNSHDSRMWFGGQGGGVPFENIRGRALFVWLSVSDSGFDVSRLGAPVMGRPRLPKAMKGLEPAVDKCLRERPSLDKTSPPRSDAKR